MLDLAPEVENDVRDYAAREGVSVNELLARIFSPKYQRPQPDQKALDLMAAIHQWQAEDATEDEAELDQRDTERAELQAKLDQARQQAGMRPLFPNLGQA